MKTNYFYLCAIALAMTITLNSCKKKGCTDPLAKNYSAEAKKDDNSCEYYTNTELITMRKLVYSSVTTTGDAAFTAQMVDFFTGSTFHFKTNGTVDFVFPAEPTANETKNWEFTNGETQILLNKDLEDEDIVDVQSLDINGLTIMFEDDDSGNQITVTFI